MMSKKTKGKRKSKLEQAAADIAAKGAPPGEMRIRFVMEAKVEHDASFIDLHVMGVPLQSRAKLVAVGQLLANRYGGGVVSDSVTDQGVVDVVVRLPATLANAMRVIEDTIASKLGKNPFAPDVPPGESVST